MKHIEIEVTKEEKALIDSVLSEAEKLGIKKNFIYRDCLIKGVFTVYEILDKKDPVPFTVAIDLEDEEKEQLENMYKPFSVAVKKKHYNRMKLVDGFKKRSVKNV